MIHGGGLSKGLSGHLYIYPTSGSVMGEFFGYHNVFDEGGYPLFQSLGPCTEAENIVETAEKEMKKGE